MIDFLGSILRRQPIGWWDLVDIAIVSFLIYEFLKLIRGTRAVQMGVGTLLIVAMFFISRLAPLQTVNWLIRNMLVYVAFAAIVIFQSDIRRALAHFGQAPFFRYFNRQEAADETIEEIVVAATMLASQRSERSSRSSGRSGFEITSRAESHSTPRSPTICWSRSFIQDRRCTTAPSSSRKTGWPRRRAFCP